MQLTKIATAALLAAAAFGMSSCSDSSADIVGEKDNLVYFWHKPISNTDLPGNSGYVSMEAYPTWGTNFLTSKTDEFGIRCNRKAAEDLTITVGVDAGMLLEGYELLPTDAVSFSGYTFTIPKGEMRASEDLSLEYVGNPSDLQSGVDYMLPLVFTSIKGAAASTNLGTGYLIVRKEALTLSTTRVGEAIDKTGWSATYGGRDCNAVFDGSMAYVYWFNGRGVNPIIIDMGQVQDNFTGFRLSVYSTSYNVSHATVYTKVNESDDFSLVVDTDMASSNPITLSWDLEQPVKARYVRLDFTPRTNNGMAITGLNLYKN